MSRAAILQAAVFTLVDEVSRLNGRFKSAFVDVRKGVGLGETEMTVLNSVVEAERAPTVPQIARSLGIARQLVQRAASNLIERGLIATAPNPDHKRALLLVAQPAGREAKRQADVIGSRIVATLGASFDIASVESAARELRSIRRALEASLRQVDR